MAADEGSSLVAVMGVAAVIAVLLVVLVGTVVFAVGQATASRASVNAKSAAEAGIESVAAQVAGGVCPVGGAASSTSPKWKAQVQSLTSATADPSLESSWVNGCPMAAPPDALTGTPFRVIATGRTGTPGAGNTSGDVRTIVAQFTVKQRPSSPEFNAAIFGKVLANTTDNLTLNGTDADILTDKFSCSTTMDIHGDVMINATSASDVSLLNTSCKVHGDLVTKGALKCPATGKIDGNAIVAGDVEWNTTCTTGGDMWVGGNFNCPSAGVIGGNLTVVGNASFSSSCSVAGNIYVGGTLSFSLNLTYPGNIWVKGNLSGNGGNTLKSTGGTIRVGGALTGGLTASRVTPTPTPVPDTTLPAPVAPDMNVYFPPTSPSLNFPKLSITDARWSGWTMRRWRNDLEPLRTNTWANVCDITNDGMFNSSGLTITTPTIYDLTTSTASGGCGGSAVGLGGGLDIKLGADMVMFVKGAQFRTPFKVESLDGNKHTLYVIEQWPTGMTSCSAPVSGLNGINLAAYGGNVISQGPNAAMMLYTPGAITSNGDATITGQMYGCNVNVSNHVTLNFQAANAGGGSAGRVFIVTERFRMDDAAHTLN
jgi:cytoskeletal protein CcmA (bactofilin family)